MNKDGGENARNENDHASGTEPFSNIDIAPGRIHSANAGVWIIDTAAQNFLPSARTKALFGFLPEEEMCLEAAHLKGSIVNFKLLKH